VTLVLSLMSDRYVVQVSDRRLTWSDGRTAEDRENKTVFLCNFAAFGYTGLARLGTAPTHEWIAEMLNRPGDIGEVVEGLRADATQRFYRLGVAREWRRTAIAGVGFLGLKYSEAERIGRQPTADDLHPFYVVVSNCFGDKPGTWAPLAFEEFETSWGLLDVEYRVLSVGQDLLPDEWARLHRQVRQCVRRAAHPYAAARILARMVREVSCRNPAVGGNVMCMLLPRPGDPSSTRGEMGLEGGLFPLVPEAATEISYFTKPSNDSGQKRFLYWPLEPLSQVGIDYAGPSYVCGGNILTNLKVTRVEAD
jgi:hypothetical protein